ncbi:MAG: helix-turn-helix transcriptional regulator [Alphaproteobacteria bacterium]|nr:helix-turn-helix transcriptional regulator [Alphaproteobacteria bacterium]MBU1795838.1 helix-turn-helix transcriptional regulator [Alphaproteobacteria bacterium]MBU2270223.1 helix-turn-helix transcriptional regulator [Alphaproteobacteria bacterium]MBU2418817.1 helix-turn-helix transcriptional regulator [Alphaproteobacteria bacterium]
MPLSHGQLWKAIDGLARREGISASALARRAGLDATSFNPSKRFGPGDPPRPRWPSTESLTQVLRATGVSLGEFAALAHDAPERPATIPMLGMAQAGQDGFFDDAGLPIGDGWEQTELPRSRDTLLSLRIAGDSMVPLYREGDRVIVDREASDVRKGDRVVVRTTGGETLAKEVAALSARAVTLASVNPAYEPRVVARRDIVWMGRILWVSQ